MAYKTRRARRAEGGKAAETEPLHPEHGHQYNAQGSPEEKEESAKSDGFKRGGMAHKKRKRGGHVEGEAAKHHLGKRARGGHMGHHVDVHLDEHHERGGHDGHHEEHEMKRARGGRAMAKGGTPFSSAHSTEPPGNKKDGPGEQAPMIP